MKSLPFQVHSRFSGTSSATEHNNNTLSFLITVTFSFFLISFYLYYNDYTFLSFIESITPWIERVQIYHAVYHAALSAGMLAGCLHALTGPDHLAALLPLCLGKRGWIGSGYGAVWGFGHAVSSVTVGYFAFRMRDLLVDGSNNAIMSGRYSYVGDFVVALTVMVIGIMGLYETREGASSTEEEQDETSTAILSDFGDKVEGNSQEEVTVYSGIINSTAIISSNKKNDDLESNVDSSKCSYLSTDCTNTTNGLIHRGVRISRCFTTSCCSQLLHRGIVCGTVFVNGIALGLSLDGFPSLAPAIMLDNSLVVAFLTSYFFSTVITMSVTSGFIGETSYWITRHFDGQSTSTSNTTPTTSKLSDHLARYTSFIACFIGWIWLIIAFMKYMFQSAVDSNNGSMMDDISWTILKLTQSGVGAASLSTHANAVSTSSTEILMAAPNNDNILVDHEFCTSTVLTILSIALVAMALIASISQEFHLSCFGMTSATNSKACGFSWFGSRLWRRKYHKSEEELL